MPRSNKGRKLILCIIDEVMNYLITVPIDQTRSEEIGDTLTENVITMYGVPEYITIEQDSAFMFSLMNYLFKKLYIKIKTVTPYNHQSLQAENEIISLSTILMKHLTNLDQKWLKYLPLATFAYNTFNTLNVAYYSLYELAFSRKPKLLLNLETMPDIKFQVHLKTIIIY